MWKLTMSRKEITRLEAMALLKGNKNTQKEVAKLLGLSSRQTKRLWKEYKRHGASSLISKRRGKPSNNRYSDKLKEEVLELVKEKYVDFGPTFLREKLSERHGINLGKETLRRLLMAHGIWKGKRHKDIRVHQLRERRSCLGELVQIDGSHHDWFEGRREKCCLLVFIDDATSRILQMRFEEGETTAGYFLATKAYIELPIAFYSDKDSIFRNNMSESIKERGVTQFDRAMKTLGIEIICANSPQAKGRVERANKTLQDRLIKEMRLREICNLETANSYLPEFIADHNNRFAKEAKNQFDMHRKLTHSEEELNLIFSFQSMRKLSKNLELSYKNTIYQIQVAGHGYALRYAKVTVCKDLKGDITLLYKGRHLTYKCYNKRNKVPDIISEKELNQRINSLVRKAHKPSMDHPWEKYKAPLQPNALPINSCE